MSVHLQSLGVSTSGHFCASTTTSSSCVATVESTCCVSPRRGTTPTAPSSVVRDGPATDRVHAPLTTTCPSTMAASSSCQPPTVSLSPIAVTQPTTFELVCAQAAIGSSSVIVVVLYRPSAGWQVILCDPIWHVSSHSGEACFKLLYPVCFTIPVPKAYEHISPSIESQDHRQRLRAVVSKDGLTSNFDRDRFVRSYDTMRARSGAGPFVCLSRGEFAVCYQTVIQLLTT